MRRPLFVSVVAAFLFLAAVIAAMVGISLLHPNRLLEWLWQLNPRGAALFRSVGPMSGVFLLALGCGTLAAGFAFLRGHCWAWRFAVALFAVNATGDVVSYLLIHDALRALAGVLVSCVFLWLLGRNDVRRYFFRNQLTPNHSP
jgi:hypothetical protein